MVIANKNNYWIVNNTNTATARDRSAEEIGNKIKEDDDLIWHWANKGCLWSKISFENHRKYKGRTKNPLLIDGQSSRNHEEQFYPLPRNENWTQIPVHVQKKKPFNSSKTPFTLTRDANSYEASHNLDKELRRHIQFNSMYLTRTRSNSISGRNCERFTCSLCR
jgi:hypothetical protein